MQTNKVQFIKIFKNTIRRKALRNTDSGSPVLPPDKTDVQVFNADAKDYSDSRSDDGATSCSRPSTATLGEDTPGTSTGYRFRYVLSVQEKTRVTKTRSSSTNSSSSSTTVGDNHGKDETKNEYVAGVPWLAAVTPWYSSTSFKPWYSSSQVSPLSVIELLYEFVSLDETHRLLRMRLAELSSPKFYLLFGKWNKHLSVWCHSQKRPTCYSP